MVSILMSSVSINSFANYESYTGKISEMLLMDNGTDKWGIRIKIDNPDHTYCVAWYIKINTALRKEMYSTALSAQAQGKEITLMRRSNSDDVETKVCNIHRMYIN